jgi:predicted dehydrogenase
MAIETMGVGIVGGSTQNPGWAVYAHIPALRALPDYELRAVSTSQRSSAEAAARDLGVAAFDNHAALIAHPGVDLVVVTVKVPNHRGIISSALAAGKMVYSEWPLGNGLAEASELAAQAQSAGVRTVVGLQARCAPAIRYLRDLVADGYIGEVLATTLVASGSAWGPATSRSQCYLNDQANGATLLSVSTLHAVDALSLVLGDFATVAAQFAIRRKHVRIIEDGATLPVTAPDHIAISASLRSGAIASIFYRGGVSRGDNLLWEINGSRGDIRVSCHVGELELGEAPGNIQVDHLKIEGGRDNDHSVSELPVPNQYYDLAPQMPLGGIMTNVGFTYAQLAKDIREGTHLAPDFSHALKSHQLLRAIEMAASTGATQVV